MAEKMADEIKVRAALAAGVLAVRGWPAPGRLVR